VSRCETRTEIVRDRAIVKVSGYLSSYGGERLEEEVGNLLHRGNREIVINFRETDMVNSVGVSILIGVIEKVRDARGRLSFAELTPVNEEIFRLMGLHKHVPFLGASAEGDLTQGTDEAAAETAEGEE
jgi:anti-anti-sigma factor